MYPVQHQSSTVDVQSVLATIGAVLSIVAVLAGSVRTISAIVREAKEEEKEVYYPPDVNHRTYTYDI